MIVNALIVIALNVIAEIVQKTIALVQAVNVVSAIVAELNKGWFKS